MKYKWFGDGYITLGFSSGYVNAVSTHMQVRAISPGLFGATCFDPEILLFLPVLFPLLHLLLLLLLLVLLLLLRLLRLLRLRPAGRPAYPPRSLPDSSNHIHAVALRRSARSCSTRS